ncbi:MAG: homoserine dehydrogenase [Candidatus Hodarchaeaceae archaeon]|nr:homoserine dehydrogenase [Candidatus Hodarchaeaceae archaeon]
MRVVLVGFGNLGRGLSRAFIQKASFLHRSYGLIPRVVAAVDEFGAVVDEKGLDLARLLEAAEKKGTVAAAKGGKRGKLAIKVIEDVEADVVYELTPTNIKTGEPGLTHIKRAMRAGKHVITSNKGPLVVAFRELDSLAKRCGVEFRYSASVGGAVPVIELARKLLAGNEIREIRGVLNGTTNYILTRMTTEGAPFEIVLREAQELGIAEKDPTLDLEGIDTACKLVILADSLLGMNAKLGDVRRTGITRIGPEAIRLAQEAGQTIKLVGIARRGSLEVGPKLVPLGHPLAVGGTLNAVTFELDLAREISIAGFGAGPKETSSSLLGDLIDIHRTLGG